MVAQLIDAVEAPALMELMLAEGRAAFNESIHQSVCRQRAAGDDCASCLQYEAEGVAADRALSEFLGTVAS